MVEEPMVRLPFYAPRAGLVLPGPVLLGLALVLLVSGAGCGPSPTPVGEPSSEAAAEMASPATESPAEPPSPPPGLAFVPPEPGTYELPPIQPAADGAVLDTAGEAHRLFDYLGDRYVVLSFVYTRCADPEGCPLARVVFHRLHDRLQSDPRLENRVRLLTLSFDPEWDTPERMRRYAGPVPGPVPGNGRVGPDEPEDGPGSWTFLTTASQAELDPILDGYGQYVVPEVDEDGEPTGLLSHVLKVFLIDRERRVRNVYSSSYLHPAVVVNDLKTLLLEEGEEKKG